MSVILLNSGEFESIGDTYVLELLPLTGLLSINSYSDNTTGETVGRFFQREFSYVKNSDLPVPYQPLNNVNLQAISPISIDDVFIFRFKYTRIGSDSSGSLLWNEFILDNVQVQPCLNLRTNALNWAQVYGDDSKFVELNNQIRRFNEWALPTYGFYLFLSDDDTVPDTQIYLGVIPGSPCSQKDLNVILKTLWGNYLVDYHFQIDIDLWDGLRS